MPSIPASPPRLTDLAHGGGCGCKIAPAVLEGLLGRLAPARHYAELLVGTDTRDDAAVYRLNAEQAIVATTDFFMPIVDDPYDFGRIAAANALSDIYAMGGRPLFALALVGMPINVLSHETIAQVLAGGADICARAGIPIAGGHSIDSREPIYGLAATGVVHPEHLRRNSDALDGDMLILGKPLGVGILSAALKQNRLDDDGYAALVDSTTRLNLPGMELARIAGVHAMTDVTGFGLLGHLLEMCRGAGLQARVDYDALPLLEGTVELAEAGVVTGASARNWAACEKDVRLHPTLPAVAGPLLSDPQTSGGLLLSCDPKQVEEVLALFHEQGFPQACVIGQFTAGTPPRIQVRPSPPRVL